MVWLGWAVTDHADGRSHCPLGNWWNTPATVRGGGGSMAKPVGGRSSPLIDDWPVGHIWIVPRLGPFDLHLLVLDVHVVLRHGSVHSRVVLKTEETKSSSLLLLLVIHDHHLSHPSVSAEEASQVCLSDARGKTSEEDFRPVCVLLRFLHRSRIARLWVNGPPVQGVGTALDDSVDVVWVAEGDEPKAAAASRLRILHHHTVDHVTKPGGIETLVFL